MKVLVIIPAYNEEENILRVVRQLEAANTGCDYVVINDCSKDNTPKILDENKINVNEINVDLCKNISEQIKRRLENRLTDKNDENNEDINKIKALLNSLDDFKMEFEVLADRLSNLYDSSYEEIEDILYEQLYFYFDIDIYNIKDYELNEMVKSTSSC